MGRGEWAQGEEEGVRKSLKIWNFEYERRIEGGQRRRERGKVFEGRESRGQNLRWA